MAGPIQAATTAEVASKPVPLVVLQGKHNYFAWRREVDRFAILERYSSILDRTEGSLSKPRIEDHVVYVRNGEVFKTLASASSTTNKKDPVEVNSELTRMSFDAACDEYKAQQTRIDKVLKAILGSVSFPIAVQMRENKVVADPRAAMAWLEKTFGAATAQETRDRLRAELEGFELTTSSGSRLGSRSMADYIERQREVFAELKKAGDEDCTDNDVCLHILKGLPTSYNGVKGLWGYRASDKCENPPLTVEALEKLLLLREDILREDGAPVVIPDEDKTMDE